MIYNDIKSELDYYLYDLDADREERKCARMWVKDGHWITDNDYDAGYPDDPYDFLTAIRTIPEKWFETCKYTDSFYDPLTQEYIRSLNPTRTEMKKLRDYIRSGGRFTVFLDGVREIDYITFLRDRELYEAEAFDAYFQEWITKYGAEFLVKNKLEKAFLTYLRRKEDYQLSNCHY